jgi:ABC-type spermidine/putrescine transport system permease subunit II
MTRLFVALNVFIYAFILSAVVFVMVLSFSLSAILRFPPEGVSLVWYRKMLAYGPFWDSMGLSLVIAAGASLLAMLLGLPAALAVVRYRSPAATSWRRSSWRRSSSRPSYWASGSSCSTRSSSSTRCTWP